MKQRSSTAIWLMVLLCLFLNGCTNKDVVKEKEIKPLIPLEEYMFGEVVNNKTKIYNLQNGMGVYLGEWDNLIDLRYNVKEKIYAKLIYLEEGNNLNRNKIVIETKNDEIEINNFFSALDMRMSPNGWKLAYRYYKDDDLGSIEDMVVFDIKNKKEIELNINTIISGNLYDFLDEDTIVYYGIDLESKERGIFKYSFSTKKEENIYKVSEGNITGFNIITGEEMFFINNQNESSKLGKINLKNLEYEYIGSNIERLYSTIDVDDDMYYFLMKEVNKKAAIYKYDGERLKRATYNFPNNVGEEYPLLKDPEGNVYFVGYNEDISKRDIYSIKNDGTVNLLSKKEEQYRTFREK